MVEYIRVSDSNLIMNANNATVTSVAILNTIQMPFTFCDAGYKQSATAGQWNEWTTIGCNYWQIVNSNFDDLCRSWDTTYYSWSVSTLWPIDFYMENGIWKRCPIGWSEWSSGSVWSACDSGLALTAYSNGTTVWKCSNGNYGVTDYVNDVLNCSPWTSPCTLWDVSATNWTGCSSPNFLIGGTWTTSWGTGKYGDTTGRTCKEWGANWNVCTDNTTWTTWSATYFLYNGAWVSTWPTNSLVSGSIWNPCSTGCSSWNTLTTNCTAWNSGYFLKGSTWVASWGTGQYGDSTTRTWQAWDTTVCVEWTSSTIWTQWISSKMLFQNGTWSSSWLSGTYQDQYNATFLIWRNWPSTWASWTNMTYWNTCQPGFYKWTIDASTIRWVYTCPNGYYSTLDIDGVTKICSSCLSNWASWSSATSWSQWITGKVSQNTGSSDACQTSWNAGYFNLNGVCKVWDTNWASCTSNNQWTTWAAGYSLNGTVWVLNANCINNYYISSSSCLLCPTGCNLCTSATAWTSCSSGYSLSSGLWISNWGNKYRDELETWDDGNTVSGDGWSSTWQVELNYIWFEQTSPNPDIWYWNPGVISSKWGDFWEKIEIIFNEKLTVNVTSLGSPASSDPIQFWLQVIDSSLHSTLGSLSTWYLYIDEVNNTHFEIYFSPDATFGDSQPTTLILTNFQTNNGCTSGIPQSYSILELPIDVPQIVIGYNSLNVPLCSDQFMLDIFSSKGITARNPKSIVWNVLSISSITTSPEKISLDTMINTQFSNMKYMKFDSTSIASVSGKKVEIQVNVTNFLNQSTSQIVLVNFLSTKTLILEGVFSNYELVQNQDQILFVSAQIPFCSGDDKNTIKLQQENLIIKWDLYDSSGTIIILSLQNWVIPKGTISYPNTYKLLFTASNPADSTQTVTYWSNVLVKMPDISVFIDGGDKSISLDIDNNLVANVQPINSNVTFKWSWIEDSTGTFWVSPNNVYLLMQNSPNATIPANSLFPNLKYRILVTVTDNISGVSAKHSVAVNTMQGMILDIKIDSQKNKNGYIDRTTPSLFVWSAIFNSTIILNVNATYTWSITDSIGNIISLSSGIQILNNLRMPEYTFEADETYKVKVTVNYLTYTGSASVVYNTMIDSNYVFEVQPSTGVALSTEFMFIVTTQNFINELSVFTFGYFKNNTKYFISHTSTVPIQAFNLPQGETGNLLTVFWEITNFEGKVYHIDKKVTVSQSTMTSTDITTILDTSNAESPEDSISMLLYYQALKSNISASYQEKAVNYILNGLHLDGKSFINI